MRYQHTIYSDEKKFLLKLLKEHKARGTKAQKRRKAALIKGLVKEFKKRVKV